MKNNLLVFTCLLAFIMSVGFSSCKKQSLEKDALAGLYGSWTIDSSKSQIFDYDARNTLVACGENIRYSGKFILESNNSGSLHVYASHCDTIYTIFKSSIEDFSLEYTAEGQKEPFIHRYYGSYTVDGDVVQFKCWADPFTDVLSTSTSTITLHLDEKHDGSKNLNQLAIYDMELVLNRD